jgi:hypothetical protein
MFQPQRVGMRRPRGFGGKKLLHQGPPPQAGPEGNSSSRAGGTGVQCAPWLASGPQAKPEDRKASVDLARGWGPGGGAGQGSGDPKSQDKAAETPPTGIRAERQQSGDVGSRGQEKARSSPWRRCLE